MTELLERRPFAELPLLALLSGGMTNMTANDVGLRGRPARALARLIAEARQGTLAGRRIERTVDQIQVASTVGALMGVETEHAEGAALEEVFG